MLVRWARLIGFALPVIDNMQCLTAPYPDRSAVRPSVFTSISVVSLFVIAVLVVFLFFNLGHALLRRRTTTFHFSRLLTDGTRTTTTGHEAITARLGWQVVFFT